jgi:hypothetical protein
VFFLLLNLNFSSQKKKKGINQMLFFGGFNSSEGGPETIESREI